MRTTLGEEAFIVTLLREDDTGGLSSWSQWPRQVVRGMETVGPRERLEDDGSASGSELSPSPSVVLEGHDHVVDEWHVVVLGSGVTT